MLVLSNLIHMHLSSPWFLFSASTNPRPFSFTLLSLPPFLLFLLSLLSSPPLPPSGVLYMQCVVLKKKKLTIHSLGPLQQVRIPTTEVNDGRNVVLRVA